MLAHSFLSSCRLGNLPFSCLLSPRITFAWLSCTFCLSSPITRILEFYERDEDEDERELEESERERPEEE